MESKRKPVSDCELDEDDKFNLFEILPFLRKEKTMHEELLKKLGEMQIEKEDLKFIEVKDLVPPLGEVKARRLVAGWRKNMKPNGGKSMEVVSIRPEIKQ